MKIVTNWIKELYEDNNMPPCAAFLKDKIAATLKQVQDEAYQEGCIDGRAELQRNPYSDD